MNVLWVIGAAAVLMLLVYLSLGAPMPWAIGEGNETDDGEGDTGDEDGEYAPDDGNGGDEYDSSKSCEDVAVSDGDPDGICAMYDDTCPDCGLLFPQCIASEESNWWCECFAGAPEGCLGTEPEAAGICLSFLDVWFDFAKDADPSCEGEIDDTVNIGTGWAFSCRYNCNNLGTYFLDVVVEDCIVTNPGLVV